MSASLKTVLSEIGKQQTTTGVKYFGAFFSQLQTTPALMGEWASLLKYGREHAELVDKYRGEQGMTTAERTQAAARRVGLTVPEVIDYQASSGESSK